MSTANYASDRTVALDLVRATEVAAIAADSWVGRGNKNSADGAAVDAMRAFLHTVQFDGVVVIGEGEKDEAPMLFNGESVGNGTGWQADIAVDPIDGTSLTAAGRPGAIAVLAAADRGSMLDASSVFYMDKIITDHHGIGVCSLELSTAENIKELAKAKGKPVNQIVVTVLDRPRHQELIEEIHAAGARTNLILDGDVVGGIQAADPFYDTDMVLGRGGSPEGVITACAVKALNGLIEAKPAPKDDAERQRGIAAGLDVDKIYRTNDLVAGENAYFIGTGVTNGMVSGVQHICGGAGVKYVRTQTLLLRSTTKTKRLITTDHLVK